MSRVETLLRRASEADARGRCEDALLRFSEALEAAGSAESRFEVLLWRARCEATSLRSPEKALSTYREARQVALHGQLQLQVGEADMGIGMMLMELRRSEEGVDAMRRAARAFRRAGNTLLRGCAEVLLADEALRTGDLTAAERSLDLATDLLEAAAEPRMLSNVLTLRAEALALQGLDTHAQAVLRRAENVARGVHDPGVESQLSQRRVAVTQILAGLLPRHGS